MSVLVRAIRAALDEINTPEMFIKGDEFQSYVRQYLFPKDKYAILQKTHTYKSNKDDFIANTVEPDFKFRSIRTGREFFVEAKYRSNYFDGGIDACKPYQLRRYLALDTETPVYLAIGVGQEPSAPGQVFFARITELRYPRLFRSFLKTYEINVDRPVEESFFG